MHESMDVVELRAPRLLGPHAAPPSRSPRWPGVHEPAATRSTPCSAIERDDDDAAATAERAAPASRRHRAAPAARRRAGRGGTRRCGRAGRRAPTTPRAGPAPSGGRRRTPRATAPAHEDERRVELEQLVRVGRAGVERERQALEVLDAEEADRLVQQRRRGRRRRTAASRAPRPRPRPAIATRGGAGCAGRAPRRCRSRAGRPPPRRRARRPPSGRCAARAAARRSASASAAGFGPGVDGHAIAPATASQASSAGAGARPPQREAVARAARPRAVERHADDPPRTRSDPPNAATAQQQRLAGPVVPPEVAVRPLAVADPPRRLQHQPLVVRPDAPPDRARREQRAGETAAFQPQYRAAPDAHQRAGPRQGSAGPPPRSAPRRAPQRPPRAQHPRQQPAWPSPGRAGAPQPASRAPPPRSTTAAGRRRPDPSQREGLRDEQQRVARDPRVDRPLELAGRPVTGVRGRPPARIRTPIRRAADAGRGRRPPGRRRGARRTRRASSTADRRYTAAPAQALNTSPGASNGPSSGRPCPRWCGPRRGAARRRQSSIVAGVAAGPSSWRPSRAGRRPRARATAARASPGRAPRRCSPAPPPRARHRRDPPVGRGGEPGFAGSATTRTPRSAQEAERPVGRAVVDDHHLVRRARLRRQRVEQARRASAARSSSE